MPSATSQNLAEEPLEGRAGTIRAVTASIRFLSAAPRRSGDAPRR